MCGDQGPKGRFAFVVVVSHSTRLGASRQAACTSVLHPTQVFLRASMNTSIRRLEREHCGRKPRRRRIGECRDELVSEPQRVNRVLKGAKDARKPT